MAKRKKGSVESTELEFPRTGNPWIDAGIVGLYRILDRRSPYVDPPEGFEDIRSNVAVHRCSCVCFAVTCARAGTAINER
jgi:hypothetical protein